MATPLPCHCRQVYMRITPFADKRRKTDKTCEVNRKADRYEHTCDNQIQQEHVDGLPSAGRDNQSFHQAWRFPVEEVNQCLCSAA